MSLNFTRGLLVFALFAAPACDSTDIHMTSSSSLITAPTPNPTAPTPPGPNPPGPAMPLPFPAPNPPGPAMPLPFPAPNPPGPVSPPVQTPGFLIVVTSNPQSILRGGTITFVVSVRSINGFRGVVTLVARILPGNELWAGSSWSPRAVTLAPDEVTTSTLTIATNSATAAGPQTITVEGRSGDVESSANILLTVR
jgi:hypothetical protein